MAHRMIYEFSVMQWKWWVLLFWCEGFILWAAVKQIVNRCWDMISQEHISGETELWSKRLMLVIRAHGGHIGHHLR